MCHGEDRTVKLTFRLLVVDDDTTGSVQSALDSLVDWLEAKGFDLELRQLTDATQKGVREVITQGGGQFDLVMVDYDLQRKKTGADVVKWLRKAFRYTEMVFYSGLPVRDLYNMLVEKEVEGVFVAQRGELDDVLQGLADIVVGKAVDLNHTRGIAMAEVAEHEVLMAETLDVAFRSAGEPRIDAIAERTVTRLIESKAKLLERAEKLIQERGLRGVIHDGRVFTASDKSRAMRRLFDVLAGEIGEAVKLFERYETDVLDRRNILAHVREEVGPNGEVVLRARRGQDEEEITVNEAWMTECRTSLRAHRRGLEQLSKAVRTSVEANTGVGDGED